LHQRTQLGAVVQLDTPLLGAVVQQLEEEEEEEVRE
jgi:hypothetical protein